MKNEPQPADYTLNLLLASAAGMSGCLTLILVMGFLLIGLWLDSVLDTRPVVTITLIIISIPFALWITLRVALSVARTIERRQYPNTNHE